MQRLLAALGTCVVGLAIFLFLPSGSVLLFMSPAFVAHEYAQPSFPPAELYSPADRLRLAQETVRYLNGGRDVAERLREMRHDGRPVYNEREVQHLVDVWMVVYWLRWAWRLAALILGAALVLAIWVPGWRMPVARGLFQGSAALVATLLTILISALLSFDWFFVRFHQVFFASGTWIFDYTDSLIQFYPVEFWMDATWKLGAAILVEALAVGGLALTWLGRGR